MVAKLDTLVRSQEQFVADASHQLRHPADRASPPAREPRPRRRPPPASPSSRARSTEVERLSRARRRPAHARARRPRSQQHRSRADFGAVVDERVAAWSALADERDVQLQAQLDAGLAALVTPGRIEQVLDNLLANALDVVARRQRRSPSPPTRADGWVELHVIDEGPGMNADERERAFDRFWRAGDGGDGFGLGLAIVERLVARRRRRDRTPPSGLRRPRRRHAAAAGSDEGRRFDARRAVTSARCAIPTARDFRADSQPLSARRALAMTATSIPSCNRAP